MALVCPQCSQVNQEATVFCRSCGYRFQGNENDVNDAATIRQTNLAGLSADADPSDTLKSGQPPVAQPTPVMVTPQPQAQAASPYIPAYGQAAPAQNPLFPPPSASQGGYMPQQPVYGQYPAHPAPQATPSPVTTLQRGFAGKGTPVHHRSWLVESKQATPQTLTTAFVTNLQKQQVMGVVVESERLREQGIVLEERDYVKVRYGTSSVFVYFAPMGQNLYISRMSTIQQPYSRVRIAVAITLAVLMLISLILFAAINPTFDPVTGNPGAFGFVDALKTFFGYAFFGLLFFFLIAVFRSVVFHLTDKDFLAMLRPNRLSDFSLDALSCIEQTTDQTLRQTLQEAGLEASAITLAHSNTPQQALHRF